MTAIVRRLALGTVVLSVMVGCTPQSKAPAHPEAAPARWATWTSLAPEDIKVAPPPAGQADAMERAAAEPLVVRREESSEPFEYLTIFDWLRTTIELVRDRASDPPSAARAYAYTFMAMHDAVVVAWHWKYVYGRAPLRGRGPVPSYPSEHAALAAAAARVLAHLFPDYAASEAIAHRFDRAPRSLDDLAQGLAAGRVEQGSELPSDADAGLALGRAVADRVVAQAQSDGSTAGWSGTRPPGVGGAPEHWSPPPDLAGPPARPEAATWKPLVLRTARQLRPPPPPAYGSPEFVAEARELLDLYAAGTGESGAIYWSALSRAELPPPLWAELAENGAESGALTTPMTVRCLAALAIAQYDATLAVWDAKYTYWSPRPINAVRDLGLDPTWPALLSAPLSPAYPSVYAAIGSASAVVLDRFLPGPHGGWATLAAESGASRLAGGVQFRSDDEAGLALGRAVGRLVLDRLKPGS